MKRATADSNIYVSALRFGGKPLELLRLAQDGQIDLALSDDILAETLRVLGSAKFQWTAAMLREADTLLRAITTHVTPTEVITAVPGDPTDDRILEYAVASGSDTVVTGDAHLLSIDSFRGIRIQKVADFLTEGRSR